MQGGQQGAASAAKWIIASFFFAGVFLLVVFGMFQVLSPENDNLTFEAKGYVSRVETTERYSKGRTKYTHLTYVTFEDSDHRTFTARSVVNGSKKRHNEGDRVTVFYDPKDPEAGCLIAGDEDRLFMFNAIRYFCGIGGAASMVIGGVLLIYFKFVRRSFE